MAKSAYVRDCDCASAGVLAYLDGNPDTEIGATLETVLRRVCAHWGVGWPDVSQLQASLRTAGESNERLREQCAADHTRFEAEAERLLGEADGLRQQRDAERAGRAKAHARINTLEAERTVAEAVERDLWLALGELEATARSLREEVEGTRVLLNQFRRRVDDLLALRAADAPVVEVGVEYVRSLRERDVHYGNLSAHTQRLWNAVEGHPAFKPAEPAPEPEHCGFCGEPMDSATAPLCSVCWTNRDTLNELAKGDGDEEAGE